jgi:hypothetical protein
MNMSFIGFKKVIDRITHHDGVLKPSDSKFSLSTYACIL